MIDDHQVTLATIAELTDRACERLSPRFDDGRLPNPLVTARNLDHHLDRATTSQAAVSALTTGLARVITEPLGLDRSAEVQAALIHCIHQLDHRAKAQERRLIDVEAELSEARRRLSRLESRIG